MTNQVPSLSGYLALRAHVNGITERYKELDVASLLAQIRALAKLRADLATMSHHDAQRHPLTPVKQELEQMQRMREELLAEIIILLARSERDA